MASQQSQSRQVETFSPKLAAEYKEAADSLADLRNMPETEKLAIMDEYTNSGNRPLQGAATSYLSGSSRDEKERADDATR